MRVTGPGDRILVARARMGDASAFEALVRRHARAAFAVAWSVLANHDDAEDVCQEAWVRALERLEECRHPDRFAFWLLQIVRNRARNYVQHRRVRTTEPLETAFGADGPAGPGDPRQDLTRERQRLALERAMVQLPESLREVLLLHDLSGWRHREIAAELGISEVLSRQRLFQARAKLRQLLADLDRGGPS
jgi:RNA polymerase sigma-70 factor (ECF subfamily)